MKKTHRLSATAIALILCTITSGAYFLTSGGQVTTVAAEAATNASETVSIEPYRAYDSREDVSGKIRTGSTWLVDVSTDASGDIKLPADAKGVFYNLTYTEAKDTGFLTVAPGDSATVPSVSSINFADGLTSANAGFVALPAVGHSYAGQLTVSAGGGGSAHFIIDITGYVK